MKKVWWLGVLVIACSFLLVGCASLPVSTSDSFVFEEFWWQERVDAVFEDVPCPLLPPREYAAGLYAGSLIDSHYHLPNIPESFVRGGGEKNGITPVLGRNVKVGDMACTLQQEGTMKVFSFFPVYDGMEDPQVAVVKKTMELHSDLFVPFIMPPDDDNSVGGSPTVSVETLERFLEGHEGLFQGYGEIGLYARDGGAAALSPDAQRLLEIYPVLEEHNLMAYLHLGMGHGDAIARVAKQYPDMTFVFHGDQLVELGDGMQNLSEIGRLLDDHPNIYYTVDELYGNVWLIRPGVSKEDFLSHLENDEVLLEQDLVTWKEFIESHPDQVMWGSDRGPNVLWSYDVDVGMALTDYVRMFIARLDPAVQENFAYKNAQRISDQSGLVVE